MRNGRFRTDGIPRADIPIGFDTSSRRVLEELGQSESAYHPENMHWAMLMNGFTLVSQGQWKRKTMRLTLSNM